MVSNLFLVHAEVTDQQRGGHMRKSSTVTRRYQAPTVSSKFQQSLLELVEKMERWTFTLVKSVILVQSLSSNLLHLTSFPVIL